MLYDKDIREPLFEYLEEVYGKVRIFQEKSMGRSRADVIMVTDDSLAGIEIKSDADSYTRLEHQVKDYDSFFDYNIIVIGTSHAAHVAEHVPKWWGIITVEEVEEQPDFYFFRRASENPKVSRKNQLELLWREELARIQEKNNMYKYKEKSKQFVREKIYETIPEEILIRQICHELFERDYTQIAERINAYRLENGQKKRRKRRYRRRKK